MPKVNSALHKARTTKNDEFYTHLEDIENEMKYYREYFKDKVVYCNCDDPVESKFYQHFKLKFSDYGLRKLITTCYKSRNSTLFTDNSSNISRGRIYEERERERERERELLSESKTNSSFLETEISKVKNV